MNAVETKVAAILAGVNVNVADLLAGHAAATATALKGAGWTGGGANYRVSPACVAGLRSLLGRAPRASRVALVEACIRAHLDAE